MRRVALSPQEGFATLHTKAAALTSLELHSCGRLHDEHLLAIVHVAPQLRAITLGGPFLVTDHALTLVVRQTRTPLERFCVTYCPRLGAGTLRALADRCASSLTVLKLVGCDNVRDADLAPLAALQRLAKLHLQECTQLTDAGILPVLVNVAGGLTSLRLDGCTALCAAASGLPSAIAVHTLPIAQQEPPRPTVRPTAVDAAAEALAAEATAAIDPAHDGDDGAEPAAAPSSPSRRPQQRRRRGRAADETASPRPAPNQLAVSARSTPVLLNAGVFALLGPTLCAGATLARLDVASTAFDDVALGGILESCPGLERLDLTRTLVSGTGVAQLVAAPCTPHLTHLSLNRVATGGVEASTLLALAAVATSLQRLDVSWLRSVDDDVVAAFRANRHLRYMAVWGCNRLTDVIVALAERLPALELVGAFFVR